MRKSRILVVNTGILLCAGALVHAGTGGAVPVFHHPSAITNHYLPLGVLQRDILEGREGRRKIHIERTAMPGTRAIQFHGTTVHAKIIEDRELEDGKVSEVTLDYFAQADDGTVYYMGEDVNQYRNGRVVAHEGAWLTGINTQKPGILMPAHPRIGQKFRSEDVPGITREDDMVVSTSETVTIGEKTYHNCVKIREMSDGVEFKYYAPGVGVVREASGDSTVDLKEHRAGAIAARSNPTLIRV